MRAAAAPGRESFFSRNQPRYNVIANRGLKYLNYPLLFITLALLTLGLVSLFSASAIYSENKGMSSFHYAGRQGLWIVMGMAAAAAAVRADLEKLRPLIKPFLAVTALLLVVTLFMPPVAHVRRWIPLGFMKLQTSELAKVAVILYLADFFDRNMSLLQSDWRRLVRPFCAVSVLLALIAAEPDLGTPALLFGVMLMLFFAAGIKLRYVLAPIAAAVPVVIVEFIRHPYRIARLQTFLDPFAHIEKTGYQLSQSLLAVGSGGWFGKGLGASQLKLLYLPEAHTDFIFPIMAEELGLAGTLLVTTLFTALLVKGARIARNAPSLFTSLTALGFTLVIVAQAFFNIAMSIGLVPTKGIPLPFFSYGGSSIIVTLLMTGVILNVSAHRSGMR